MVFTASKRMSFHSEMQSNFKEHIKICGDSTVQELHSTATTDGYSSYYLNIHIETNSVLRKDQLNRERD